MTTGVKIFFIFIAIILGMSMCAVSEGSNVYDNCYAKIETIILDELKPYPQAMREKEMVTMMVISGLEDNNDSILTACEYFDLFPAFEVDFRKVLSGTFKELNTVLEED